MFSVKNSMRDVIANAELIKATRIARLASAESLRALEVEQETLASLTPTFLNLLFTTQANLASARTAEFQSIVGFNTAVGIITSGALTLLAVFLYSGLRPAEQAIKRLVQRLLRPSTPMAARHLEP